MDMHLIQLHNLIFEDGDEVEKAKEVWKTNIEKDEEKAGVFRRKANDEKAEWEQVMWENKRHNEYRRTCYDKAEFKGGFRDGIGNPVRMPPRNGEECFR